MAALIVSLAGGYDAIVAPATTNGKNVMPRVAALLDVMQISEIIEVDRARHVRASRSMPATPSRPCKSIDAKKVITVRTASFQAAAEGGSAAIENAAAAADPGAFRVRRREAVEVRSAGTHLGQDHRLRRPRHADRRKFQHCIEPVADKLGAAVGASRAAVDAGYVPNDYQVGQTGKVVAPDLYIAVGISGAIQHLAGMKDSKIIVAINKDEEAPIFQVADYGLVADLYQALPELAAELDKVKR